MTRAEQLAIWRAGYQAGLAAGNRQRRDYELALHHAAVTEFHAQRQADQQAKAAALVLDAIHLLAEAMLGKPSELENAA